MNRYFRLHLAALLALGFYCTQVVALTLGDYVYNSITVPDAYRVRATGVNKQGQVVGYSFSNTKQQAFIRQPDGSMQFLQPPLNDCPGGNALPYDVNDAGHMIGLYPINYYCDRAPYFFDGTNYTFLPLYSAYASGMNNLDQVVGTELTGLDERVAFLYSNGQKIALIPSWIIPYGINDLGHIVGLAGSHGFLQTTNGSFRNIDVPGATNTQLQDINNHGDMVGKYALAGDAPNSWRSFAFIGGNFYDIQVPGAWSTEVSGINDNRHLVGTYDAGAGQTTGPRERGFIAIPTASLPPTVSGFWPGSAPAYSFVFVFGANYARAGTSVSVNGIPATFGHVLDSSLLIFQAPPSNTTGPIVVSTSGGSATSSASFGVPLTGLALTGFWPQTVTLYKPVFVFGNGFVPNATNVKVGATAVSLVQVISSDLLIFYPTLFPTPSGPISVTTSAGTATSSTDLIIIQ